MKNLFLLIAISLLTACGTERVVTRDVPGPEVEVEVDPIDYAEEMAGYYQLPSGGYIELTALNDGRVRIELQQILTVNKDKGLAYHPSISAGPHVLRADGSLYYVGNLSYSSTTHDVEKDGSTSNISGSKRTEVKVQLNDEGYLEINIIVKDGTSVVSNILVNRTIESLD